MKKIFVDMDGVLANFDAHFERLYGVLPKDGFNKTRWEDFCKSEQFKLLNPFPGAFTLVDFLEDIEKLPGVSVMILGSTGGYEYHGTVQEQKQKLSWLEKHKIDFPAIFVPGKRFKRFHATSSSMLIDDHPENVNEFITYGGHAHRYTTPGLAIRDIEDFLKG